MSRRWSHALVAVLAALHWARPGPSGPTARDLPGQGLLVALVASQAILIAAILPIAASAFTGGLGGFGLRLSDAGRCIRTGLLYLFAIFPVMMMVLVATEAAFRRVGWRIDDHSLLKMIQGEPGLGLVALVIASAVLAAPVAEELFFRGLVQSFLVRFFRVMMPPKGWPTMAFWARPPELLRAEAEAALARARELGEQPPDDLGAPPSPGEAGGQVEPLSPEQESRRAVAAIVVSAAVFAAAHYSVPVSVPAIFVLGLALGYAYERTGSLLAPITIHLGFNGLNIALFLLRPYLPMN